MSTVQGIEQKHEIIIVRRGGHDEHDDHHGGVWKIAFADFMTAMMCFFLVMWLINAANEETRAAVASYFNPIKLTDRNASRKGLEDIGEGPNSSDESANNSAAEAATEASGAGPKMTGPSQRSEATNKADDVKHSDQNLFSNPYSVLAEIAAETGTMQNVSEKGDGGAQTSGPATGASGGESFRDPFAPDFWSQQVAPTYEDPDTKHDESEATEIIAELPPEPSAATAATPAAAVPDADDPGTETAPVAAEPVAAPPASETVETIQPEPPAAPVIRPETPNPETLREAKDIREELEQAFGDDERVYEGISVDATPHGVSISVTDLLNFGMFEIGSAVPKRDLVLAMEKIANILSERTGKITLNGHTDARPFSSKTYDNWRLSSARAHSAYYMLVRAGLDEKRVAEVAGFADRRLKVPDDPFDDANRRIEILLETGG